MPIDIDIKQLDDDDGIEATLMRHYAQGQIQDSEKGGHSSCRQ